MKHLIVSFLVAFTLLTSLFSQPRIISISYSDDDATLTRNSPPGGVMYYWQGTSCGTLTDNSNLTYVATTSGTYYLRAYASSAGTWSASCASTIVSFPDVTAPVLSDVTTGPIFIGEPIAATSNEGGTIYLVPEGTAGNLTDISNAKVSEASATANVAVTLSTTGISAGDYIVYAVDMAENISTASAVITINPVIEGLEQHKSGSVLLYPPVVEDILNIRSEVRMNSLQVFSMGGTMLMNLAQPGEQVDLSNFSEGVYVVRVQLSNNKLYVGRIVKK